MSVLELPSGKEVRLHEPSYGEVLALVLNPPLTAAGLVAAKVALIARGLSAAEVSELSFADGTKLAAAVAEVWERVTASAD